MSDRPQGEGWWLASDGKWYPPESAARPTPELERPQTPPGFGSPPGEGWWLASDGNWYPPDASPGTTHGPLTSPSRFGGQFEYAGFWRRAVAYVIDVVVVTVVVIGAVAVLQEAGLLVAILGAWLYWAGFESSNMQATLGKRALGIIVTDMDGNRISFGRATGRFAGRIITHVVPFAIGYIMAGFTQRKQALHDLIASTLVIVDPA